MTARVQSFIVDKMDIPGEPGAIQFVKNPSKDIVAGFNHACPCGCGTWSFIRLNPVAWAPGTAPMWQRTGDDLHMTLTPSIGIHGATRTHQPGSPYHWHGYLRNGVFEEG